MRESKILSHLPKNIQSETEDVRFYIDQNVGTSSKYTSHEITMDGNMG
jgi:hypothetical protein